MIHESLPFISSSKLLAITVALLSGFGLGGCAMLPSVGQVESLKPASGYQTAGSFSAPAGEWPSDRWWQTYGDPQLDTLVDEALRDSPDLAAASARLQRAAAFSKVAFSTLLPQVNADASISGQKLSYNHLIPRSPASDGWEDYGMAALSLHWEIDFWGKNRAGFAAATSQLKASQAELAQARLNLVAAMAANYAELSRLFATRDMVLRSVEIRSKTVELFNQRFDNGMETKGSLSEAKARLAGAQGELLLIDELIGLQSNRLAALAGAGPDRALCIKRPAINLENSFGLPAELSSNLLGRRPDVAAARIMAEAHLHRIEQKKAEFYPNVNLVAFLGVQSLGLNMLLKSGSDIGGIGPAVSLPLFTAGRLQGELRGATASYNEAVANYNSTVTHALEDVANAGLSIKALSAQLSKTEEAVEAASDAHRVARNRYEGGLANYIEVLHAEDGLLNNQRVLTALQSRGFTLDVALKRALGGGYQQNKI